jgi:murein DD-endopeptidase MepM/ murein hydrolase activator NlpD
VHNYRCYGAEALAGADARVVVVRDDVPDNLGQAKSNALPETLANLGGNRVVLDLGGAYATYFHLKPLSVRVKVGDRVRTGDVLALVGNSMSPIPHLHFQLSEGPIALLSEGVPYVFGSFTRGGKTMSDQLPMDGWTLAFQDAH